MKLAFTLNNFHILRNMLRILEQECKYIYICYLIYVLCWHSVGTFYMIVWLPFIGSVYVYENPISVLCRSCIIKILTNVRQQQNQRNTNMPVARRICISFILALSAVDWYSAAFHCKQTIDGIVILEEGDFVLIPLLYHNSLQICWN